MGQNNKNAQKTVWTAAEVLVGLNFFNWPIFVIDSAVVQNINSKAPYSMYCIITNNQINI